MVAKRGGLIDRHVPSGVVHGIGRALQEGARSSTARHEQPGGLGTRHHLPFEIRLTVAIDGEVQDDSEVVWQIAEVAGDEIEGERRRAKAFDLGGGLSFSEAAERHYVVVRRQ